MANKLYNKLKEIKKSPETDLEGVVVEIILDKLSEYGKTDEHVENLFKDLSMGLSSGVVGELIYYADTHKFYDKYYEDIETLVYDLEQNMGESINPKSGEDRKNFYAWLGFEEQTRKIADKIGLEM